MNRRAPGTFLVLLLGSVPCQTNSCSLGHWCRRREAGGREVGGREGGREVRG